MFILTQKLVFCFLYIVKTKKTRKKGDYLLFKEVVSIIQLKEHLTTEGFQRIVNIKATINYGLSKELQLMFLPEEQARNYSSSSSFKRTMCNSRYTVNIWIYSWRWEFFRFSR